MSHALVSIVLAANLVAPATVAPAPAAAAAEAAAGAPPVAAAAAAATAQSDPSAAAPVVSVTVQAPTPTTPAPAPAATSSAVPLDPRAARLQQINADPELLREDRRAEGLAVGGGIMLGLGGLGLLVVALPARQLYRRSLEQAEDAEWVTEREEPAEDARYRRKLMLGASAVGGGLALVGAVMMAVGLRRKARLREPTAATLSFAPVVGGGQLGAGASVRF